MTVTTNSKETFFVIRLYYCLCFSFRSRQSKLPFLKTTVLLELSGQNSFKFLLDSIACQKEAVLGLCIYYLLNQIHQGMIKLYWHASGYWQVANRCETLRLFQLRPSLIPTLLFLDLFHKIIVP